MSDFRFAIVPEPSSYRCLDAPRAVRPDRRAQSTPPAGRRGGLTPPAARRTRRRGSGRSIETKRSSSAISRLCSRIAWRVDRARIIVVLTATRPDHSTLSQRYRPPDADPFASRAPGRPGSRPCRCRCRRRRTRPSTRGEAGDGVADVPPDRFGQARPARGSRAPSARSRDRRPCRGPRRRAHRLGEPVRRVAEPRSELEHPLGAHRAGEQLDGDPDEPADDREAALLALGLHLEEHGLVVARRAASACSPRRAGRRCPRRRCYRLPWDARWPTSSSARPTPDRAEARYGPDDLEGFDPDRDLGRPGEPPFTRGVYPIDVPRPPVDDAPVRRHGDRRGDEPPLPVPARARPDRAVGGVRPPDADGLGLRPSARRGRGRQDRRRDRLDRGHGPAARRDPARRGLDLDDDQRDGADPAPAVRARRRGARDRAADALAAPSRTTC